MERYGEALENYEKALELAEDTDEVLLHIAYVYQNMGDYETSITYLKLCLKQKHGKPGRPVRTGFLLRCNGQPAGKRAFLPTIY